MLINITRAVTANALDPLSRTVETSQVAVGSTVRDLLPEGWGSIDGETLIYLNTSRCDDWDQEVTEGEIIHFFGGVTGIETLIYLAIALVSAAISIHIAKNMDVPTVPIAANPDGSSTYGYYGFTNSFRAEGDPVPVVYGRIRVAPPIINQTISSSDEVAPNFLSLRESIYFLMAISEGPILGLGKYEGVVETQADQDAIAPASLMMKEGTGLQINGIEASNFNGWIDWRTGTLNQTPYGGSHGYINHTDTASSYILDLTPLLGQLTPIGDAAFPGGTYAAGSASLISNADPLEFVEQDLIVTDVDNCRVTIDFKKGIYTQNITTGDLEERSKTIRVQYRETDSAGTGVGDYILLPAYTVSAASNQQQTLDIPFEFSKPGTGFAPASENGYLYSDAINGKRAENEDATAVAAFRPDNFDKSTQQWTFGCHVVPELYLGSGQDNYEAANHFLFGISTPATATGNIELGETGLGHPGSSFPDIWGGVDSASVGASESGFQITIRKDLNFTYGLVGGFSPVYLCIEVWMPGVATSVGEWRAYIGEESSYSGLGLLAGTTEYYGPYSIAAGTVPSGKTATADPTSWWRHVAVQYDGADVNGPQVTCIVDGTESYSMEFSARGTNTTAPYFPQFPVTAGMATIGSFQKWIGTGATWALGKHLNGSYSAMGDMFLYNGILDAGQINLLGNPFAALDGFGNKVVQARDILENDPKTLLLLPMMAKETNLAGDSMFRNYAANATGDPTKAAGSFKVISDTKTENGPVLTPSSGIVEKSNWQVEVFVSEQTSTTKEQDTATIHSVTGISSQPYSYPSTATASVAVAADEQVNNNKPSITILCKGRIIDTWDGATDSEGNPALTPAWSRNPAWIAADLLTHPRYGLGAELTSSAIDWPSFKSWADFCDEGVPDAFGEVDVFGLDTYAYLTSSWPYQLPILKLYVGLTDTAGGLAMATSGIPKSWTNRDPDTDEPTAFVTILSVAAGGLSEEWVTGNDLLTGLNEASNQLGIHSIEYFGTPLQGYDSYAEVNLFWNRIDSSGAAVWPSGYSLGQNIYVGDFAGSLTTLGKASGYESRCMFDGTFDQADQSAWDGVLQIFAAGRAMPIKAGKKIIAIVDRPRPVVGVFGQGNIIVDSLALSYTGPKQRPNSVEGDILDEAANYERRTILVDHPSVQDPTLFDAFRKERSDFRGIVRASQAMRDATYRLNRYNLVRRHAKFSVGPDAVNLLPGDRILLSHDVPQYGFSGRLRADQITYNTYPNGGSVYNSWDQQGGPNALSSGALIREDATVGEPVITSYTPSELFALPTTNDATAPAAAQGQDGGDASIARAPEWGSQFVATAPQLYPPNLTQAPLALVRTAGYQAVFSVYVKEPALGASAVVRLSVWRIVNESGQVIDSPYVGDFTWSSGSISSTYTQTGIAASVSSIGSGWYRLGIVYSNAAAGGAVGDYLQARAQIAVTSGGGSSGTFTPVADGGKGTNFLAWGDPLDCTQTAWTRYNHGTSSVAIENITYAPPLYTATDGTYGNVIKLLKPAAIAAGTTPPNLVQTQTLATGSGISSWNGEAVTLTGYARVGAANGANDTTLTINVRFAATVDGNKIMTGDGGRATLTTPASGGGWAVASTAKTEAAGTVNTIAATVAAVRLTSSANDANWAEFSLSVAYTPSSGVPAAVSIGVSADSGGSGSGGATEMYVWGLRAHGKSSTGVTVSPYYHQKAIMTSAMFQDDASSIAAFAEGSALKLDREVTMTAGNSYELLVRSSFAPNAILNADNSEVLTVDQIEVPTSGSTTKAANAALKVSTPHRFTAHEGDVYSFGKSGQTSEDFVISRISLDPDTMQREIEADEYNEAIYNDTEFGTTGTGTISSLPTPMATAEASAMMGVGAPTGAAIGRRTIRVSASVESISNQAGGFIPQIEVVWVWPKGLRKPKEVRIYIEAKVDQNRGTRGATLPPRLLATVLLSDGRYVFSDPLLMRDIMYRIYVQPIGWAGSAMPVAACPSALVGVRKVPDLVTLPPPAVTTATRGWQQMYYLTRLATSRAVNVVEGRIGGWKLGAPAFVIDPDVSNTASDSTLVGQASTLTGRTQMQVFCRGRSSEGNYGQPTVLLGTEQLVDVLYDHSVEASNGYASAGTLSAEVEVATDGQLHFKASSSALTGTYTPTSISLGARPQRVLVNFVPEATQVRPETLGELPYALASEKIRRWSFEGAMDDLDGDDCTLKIEWRWSSTASASSVAYRVFRPGEVYARTVDFRITFVRPTADFDIRMNRLIVQALLPPNYSPSDVDGGAFA